MKRIKSGCDEEKVVIFMVRAPRMPPSPREASDTRISTLAKLLAVPLPAAPSLDNNLCERALKKAILHRKNSLFYKTLNGAEVGDLYMSLIHTCELCEANPF